MRHGQAIPCHMSLDEDEDYSDETEFAEMLDNGEVHQRRTDDIMNIAMSSGSYLTRQGKIV